MKVIRGESHSGMHNLEIPGAIPGPAIPQNEKQPLEGLFFIAG